MFIDRKTILKAAPIRAIDIDELGFPGITIADLLDQFESLPLLDEEIDELMFGCC
jgi:hypothetical protein